MAEGKSLPGTKCWIRRTAHVARISKGFSKICRSTSDWLSIIHAPCNATFYCRVAFMWRRITSASTRTFSAGRRWYEKKFFLSKIEKKKKSICCLSILSNFVASDLYYSIFFFVHKGATPMERSVFTDKRKDCPGDPQCNPDLHRGG